MSYNHSRRLFLGRTLAASAVSAAGILTYSGATQADKVAVEKLYYGPKPGIAKLNANENPFGPSPDAIKAMTEAISTGGAYYAYPAAMKLLDMLGEYYGLERENISLSAGSSPVLSFAAMAAASKGTILGPDLFWDTTSSVPLKQGGPEIKRVPNTADLDIDLDALYQAIDENVAMVHVCNPNNPTGKTLDPIKLKEFCIKASKKTLVLVDEAYNELIDDPVKNSMVPLIKQGHNVIVARTFSKIYGLAGLRVGYMLGAPDKIEWINRYGLGTYTINQAGLAAAIASFNDQSFIKFSRDKISEAKGIILDAVKANGLSALPSSTNFVFVDLGKNGDANAFRMAMAKENILIRGQYRTYQNWSRVSAGRIADVKRYADAMPKALESMQHST